MENTFEGNFEIKPEHQGIAFFMKLYMEVNRRQLDLLLKELHEMNIAVSDIARILRLPEEVLRNDGVVKDEI